MKLAALFFNFWPRNFRGRGGGRDFASRGRGTRHVWKNSSRTRTRTRLCFPRTRTRPRLSIYASRRSSRTLSLEEFRRSSNFRGVYRVGKKNRTDLSTCTEYLRNDRVNFFSDDRKRSKVLFDTKYHSFKLIFFLLELSKKWRFSSNLHPSNFVYVQKIWTMML